VLGRLFARSPAPPPTTKPLCEVQTASRLSKKPRAPRRHTPPSRGADCGATPLIPNFGLTPRRAGRGCGELTEWGRAIPIQGSMTSPRRRGGVTTPTPKNTGRRITIMYSPRKSPSTDSTTPSAAVIVTTPFLGRLKKCSQILRKLAGNSIRFGGLNTLTPLATTNLRQAPVSLHPSDGITTGDPPLIASRASRKASRWIYFAARRIIHITAGRLLWWNGRRWSGMA
jgi:hypothetical protein